MLERVWSHLLSGIQLAWHSCCAVLAVETCIDEIMDILFCFFADFRAFTFPFGSFVTMGSGRLCCVASYRSLRRWYAEGAVGHKGQSNDDQPET